MNRSTSERPPAVASQIFAGINEDAIAEIVAAAQPRKVTAKRMILTAGEKATHLFVQRAGTGRYFRLTRTGEEVVLQLLGPGDTFGIGALLKNPCPYIGSAEATSDVEVLVWEHASIRKFAALYPELADNALRIVLQYLKQYVNRHVGLVTKTAEQRLADTLLNLGHRTGRTIPTGVQVDVTNGELGALADISSFTASRLLSGWERQGAVSKSRGKVLIHSPEALVVD
jgi:CRP-like cAMP-binding protein